MQIVTNENYFDVKGYMSVSLYKKFKECEVGGLIPFGSPSLPMLVGSYVDAFVEGTLETFKLEHPELISSKGVSKGQLKADFKYADEICKFISKDKIFSQFMSGDKQTVMTGKISEVPFKIKTDSYSPGIAINDLKVMANVTNKQGKYYNFISPYGYDIQLACYQEIVRQNTGEQLPVFICAVTKENPINSVIISIPQNVLDKRLYEVEENIEHYYNVYMEKERPVGCGICKACIAKRKKTPIISMTDFIDFY